MNELKARLEAWRHELFEDVRLKIRAARGETTLERDVFAQGESSEQDIQDDIEFALIEMKSDTLNRIDTALRQIDEGTCGKCFECGGEIAEARLRALPFAVRCKDCEESREATVQRERVMTPYRGSSSFFLDVSN